MELCEGGELFERIVSKKHLEEKDAAEILFKLTHAISHCHSRGIVHRDIKAENILFEIKTKSKNDVKIIDFGLARKKVTHNLHSIVGTRDTSHRRCLKGHTIENATSGHWECSSM